MIKKKILLVIPYNRGTIGLCSLNLYKSLLKSATTEVKCVMIHKFGNGYDELEHCEYCIKGGSHGLRRFIMPFIERKWLRKIKKEFSPDVTISTLFSCSTVNVLAGGKETKIGIFHSPHTQVKEKGKIEYLITLFIYHYIYPHLDYLYCVSNEVRNSIVNSFSSINLQQVKVVYNIHDKENIVNKSLEKLSEMEQEVFKYPVILYCGRLDKNKAPDRILQAFIRQKELFPYMQLVYIGQDVDHLWSSLHEEAINAGIGERVHYWGRQNNPYKYMRHAKVLVSCSYTEGLPGVIIESMLLNTPVITTNSSEGVWEILSCEGDYSSDLNGIYIAGKGIITSNNSFKLIEEYDTDIKNLSEALRVIQNESFEKVPFLFEKNILPEYVVSKFI